MSVNFTEKHSNVKLNFFFHIRNVDSVFYFAEVNDTRHTKCALNCKNQNILD